MRVREAFARQFYPGDCGRSILDFLTGFTVPAEPAQAVAGVVPHAGWMYSGAVAAKVFEAIRRKANPKTFIIMGAVHRWATINGIYSRGGWETPFGVLEVDEALASLILQETPQWTVEEPKAHYQEHSIEVELPFVKYLFPDAKFVPIAVNPDARAVPLGARVGEIAKALERSVIVIGSTDLTHYGDNYSFAPAGYGAEAHKFVKENDARIVRLAEQMKAAEILDEAQAHQNACGAGAFAATVEAARVMDAKRGWLVEYTTSHDVAPEGEFLMAVGYAGMLF
ncbi:MAG: AmmeMemoRadiSam system protein B [Acidobacteria bacterium]|nr:AmmeMemoRadiSam system protein B [Acidobacteriota bacterium]